MSLISFACFEDTKSESSSAHTRATSELSSAQMLSFETGNTSFSSFLAPLFHSP